MKKIALRETRTFEKLLPKVAWLLYGESGIGRKLQWNPSKILKGFNKKSSAILLNYDALLISLRLTERHIQKPEDELFDFLTNPMYGMNLHQYYAIFYNTCFPR